MDKNTVLNQFIFTDFFLFTYLLLIYPMNKRFIYKEKYNTKQSSIIFNMLLVFLKKRN